MTERITDIGIYGAGGLTGRELLRLLRGHPFVRPVFVSSNQYAGRPVSSVFRELAVYDVRKTGNLSATSEVSSALSEPLVFSRHDDPLPDSVELALLATPNQSSLELLPKLLKRGLRVIDLSGSFRLHSQAVWERYYKLKHTAFELLEQRRIIFGLPEIFREKIRAADAIANPGCYPTAPILALNILGEDRLRLASVVIDSKSGVSGAGGRTEDAGFAFGGVYENFRAYKVLSHQHQPEIEEYGAWGLGSKSSAQTEIGKKTAASDAGSPGHPNFPCPLTFTPHLLPLQRGILTTMVLHWKDPLPKDFGPTLKERFRKAAQEEPFLRFYEEPEQIELRNVQSTNFVDLSIRTEGSISVLVAAIDNLVKGAAGQAIQNMNLMLGFPETTGLY